ncbi:stalk domain-containing protein [Aneurinibacillus sp. Ricciae_BoGa-3]|uniref:stalk domain-containing protein n=1 Tax=Aneurinibacillus sp. Ricciae_BoGa-3 TaxID=3022697 RepID=UPI00234025E1|nr:stalk domain-containing protein [Aneurinibacillus sp. Ricciae_BoGa-3]WCK55926.1 stalk domain-containing protein [Aneurinibacillus sp. Ricciae_BoGa-3]
MISRKKIATAVLVGIMALSVQAGLQASPAAPLLVKLQGQPVSFKTEPRLVNGRTMVDAADFASFVNGTIDTQTDGTAIYAHGHNLFFYTDLNKVAADGKPVAVNQPAVRIDNHLYIPLRWALEKLNFQLKWNASARTINVRTSEPVFVPIAESSLTPDEKAFVEKAKHNTGISHQGNLYIISRGMSPNPGYGLQIIRQESNWEQATVYVKKTSPDPGKAYAAVISYPYIAGRITLPAYTTIRFVDVDTGKVIEEATSSTDSGSPGLHDGLIMSNK